MPESTTAKRQYDSPAMAERRREILETTRLMLSEKDDFSMRELALRSGVALATLYNNFGNRDQLAAMAVMEVFEDILARPWEDPNVDFFDAIRLVRESVFDEISRVPAFARQMVAIYLRLAKKTQCGILCIRSRSINMRHYLLSWRSRENSRNGLIVKI